MAEGEFKFTAGDMSDHVKRLFEAAHDSDSHRIKHELYAIDEKNFWMSLNSDQLRFLLNIFAKVVHSDDPKTIAAISYGQAETLLMIAGKCVCNETHGNPDDLMREITERTLLADAEKAEMELFCLDRAQTFGGSELFVCTGGCGRTYKTIQERKDAGPAGLTGCCGYETSEG